MTVTINDDELLINNQFNIIFARSSRLLNSWKSENPLAQDLEDDNDNEAFSEEEFKSATDDSGLGSKAAFVEGELQLDGSFLSKRPGSNDRLLANLLGKKVAQARKKSQAPGKEMSGSKHAAPKPLAARPKVSQNVDSEDEDEGGRAGAFKSKQHNRPTQLPKDSKTDDEQMDDSAGDEETSVTQQAASANLTPATTSQAPSKPTKTKAISYLDEILAQKAKKKSKKEKKSKS